MIDRTKFPKGIEWQTYLDLNSKERTCAVYLLISGEELLYVGQSTNLVNRINEHIRRDEIPFDRFAFLELHPDIRLEMEANLIWKRKPKYNRFYPPLRSFS